MFGATIGDYVTISVVANIVPQVVIGNNSIIEAGSVDTKNIPEGKLAIGIHISIRKNLKQRL